MMPQAGKPDPSSKASSPGGGRGPRRTRPHRKPGPTHFAGGPPGSNRLQPGTCTSREPLRPIVKTHFAQGTGLQRPIPRSAKNRCADKRVPPLSKAVQIGGWLQPGNSTFPVWTSTAINGSGKMHYLPEFIETYICSTLVRAQGFFRRKVRLDLMLGSKRKHRMGTCRPISRHPWCATSSVSSRSSVTPCRGSLDGEGRFMPAAYLGAEDSALASIFLMSSMSHWRAAGPSATLTLLSYTTMRGRSLMLYCFETGDS
jgi:hypothetical protein